MSELDFIGVDVSKKKLDVSIIQSSSRSHFRKFENSETGFKSLLIWLKRYSQDPWVCMEATGHYSTGIADYLHGKKIKVSVVNPMQIKHFAKVSLSRNKNDYLDSKLIADYAKTFTHKLRLYQPQSAHQKKIRELIQLSETLKTQKVQYQNQLESVSSKEAIGHLKKLIRSIDKKLLTLQNEIEGLVNTDPKLKQTVELLTSIKGIGKLSAISLLAYLPDLSQFNNAKQLAAYAGVSPRQIQSGLYSGKTRMTKLGNSKLRKVLYMPALVAKNSNKHLKPFVTRLENNGLAPKAIVGAVMRKLLHIVFGILKTGKPFDHALV